ncbi:DUF4062 domain-containing protein [Planctomycetota bacterium]
MRWRGKVVRVFVSSTFRDLQAERDELLKRVFPHIRKLCADRDGSCTEVDLRWGIDEDQTVAGDVLPICLAEIDRCHRARSSDGTTKTACSRLTVRPDSGANSHTNGQSLLVVATAARYLLPTRGTGEIHRHDYRCSRLHRFRHFPLHLESLPTMWAFRRPVPVFAWQQRAAESRGSQCAIVPLHPFTSVLHKHMSAWARLALLLVSAEHFLEKTHNTPPRSSHHGQPHLRGVPQATLLWTSYASSHSVTTSSKTLIGAVPSYRPRPGRSRKRCGQLDGRRVRTLDRAMPRPPIPSTMTGPPKTSAGPGKFSTG